MSNRHNKFDPRKHNPNRTRFFSDIYAHTKNACINNGIDPAIAERIAREMPGTMRLVWSGAEINVPTTDFEYLTKRDYEIWDEFNGENYQELAIKYKVSERWIRKIVEYMRHIETAKRQGALDLEE